MKQYTSTEQTAKLIELGFAEPQGAVKLEQAGEYAWYNPAYSVQELRDMLPEKLRIPYEFISTVSRYEEYCEDEDFWSVGYDARLLPFHLSIYLSYFSTELIDAYFGLIVKLKKVGVI
jgi:hypothetical protein